jgi:hypothetical protein
MSDNNKIIILDLENVIINTIYPSIELPSYQQVMNGAKILNGEALTCKRNHLDTFFKYLFNNFKVGIWSSSKDKDYIDGTIDVLGIKDKIEFSYSIKKCTLRHYEICGFGYGTHRIKSINKIKGYNKEDILFIDSEPNCAYDGNVLNIRKYNGCDDDTLLKVIDILESFKGVGINSDYKGDVSYSM